MSKAKENKQNYFLDNYKLDVAEYITKKGNAEYVSWDLAYKLVKEKDVNFSFKYIKDPNGRPYFVDGERIWCEVETTMCGDTVNEIFPFMEGNRAVPTSKVTNFTLNKQLKRALVKAISLHGIGLRLWTREDLIEEDTSQNNKEKSVKKAQTKTENKKNVNPKDVLINLRKEVEQLNLKVEEKHGKKNLRDNDALAKQIDCIKEEEKDNGDRCFKRIFAYLEKSKENALEALEESGQNA